ncbi:alanine racemase [Thermogymnomonas acidicola]|uniref:alanine racemase n=1 Tax=Thermogymnomonas acidicola TaxID=399579 RepID=UPI0009462C8B|nr:alanine racemase [Thermogymnomonas acidicola]
MDLQGILGLPFETPPYMVVDIDQVERNIRSVQAVANRYGKRLRPHSKTHKIPELSRMQVGQGASGICVQKVAEAEVMAAGGVRDILVSNEVVDRRKLDRLSMLSSQGFRIYVAVDSTVGLQRLSESARYHGAEIGGIR